MKKGIVIIVLVVLMLAAVFFYVLINGGRSTKERSETTVIRVIDGDTFELESGEIVRLICIDAPEKGEAGAEEAAEYLESLILYKEARLEKDVSETDAYGRLLRYAYVNNTFVNKEMVEKGHASVFRYGNDTRRCDEIENIKNP